MKADVEAQRHTLAKSERASVEPVVRAVWRRRGRVRVSELCEELGLSERQAQRIFADSLGVAPKSYARLCRFLYACSALGSEAPGPEERRSLTEVGLDCGYYDQAHFIGDFKAFSGMTPGAFQRERRLSYLDLD